MNISVKHLEANGTLTEDVHNISMSALAKHMAFAGIGIQNSPHLYFRLFADFFALLQAWSRNPDYFLLPHPFDNDPTEKNIFSNKIGRALGDYLAKKLYKARYTHCYEHAMIRFGFPVVGPRPDFYCDTLDEQFAMEAKGTGRSSVSENEMAKHKGQSQQGPISVNFSIASVSYNLYTSPKVKFYDPKNSNVKYHKFENLQLRNLYYQSILEFIEDFAIPQPSNDIEDFKFYAFYPLGSVFSFLVHTSIISREWQSMPWMSKMETLTGFQDSYYVDVDGIGVSLTNLK